MMKKTAAITDDIRLAMKKYKEKKFQKNISCCSIVNTSDFDLMRLPSAEGISSSILIPQKSLLQSAAEYCASGLFDFKREYRLLNPAGRFNVMNLGDTIEIESNGTNTARHLIADIYPEFDVSMFMLPYILNLNPDLNIESPLRYQVRFHYMLPQTKQFVDDDVFLVVLDKKTGKIYTKKRLFRAYHDMYDGNKFTLELVPNITLQDLN